MKIGRYPGGPSPQSTGGRVQVRVQVRAPADSAGHLAITPEDYSRRQSKDLTAKSMAKLLGPTRKHASKIRNVQGEYEFLKYDSRRTLRRLLSCRTSSIRNCRCSGIGDAAARGPAGAQGLSSKSTGLRFRNHLQLESVLAALTDLENEVQTAKGLSNGFGLGRR